MKRYKIYSVVAILIAVNLLGGCDPQKRKWSYNYSFDQRYITLTTEPSNATVTLVQPFGQSPVRLGKTPLQARPVAVMTKLKSTKNISLSPQSYATFLNNAVVRIEHEGYESFYGPLQTDPNETMEHHIVLQPVTQ